MHIKTIALTVCLLAVAADVQSPIFPYGVPKEKPDMPLSKAMERAYTNYSAPTTWDNELFTKFRHTELESFDYNGGDGTISRRDPSKVVRANILVAWGTHLGRVSFLGRPREQKVDSNPSRLAVDC